MRHTPVIKTALSAAVASVLLLAAGQVALSGPASAAWITSTENLFTGDYARGQTGDIMMENGRIALVINALDHPEVNGRSGGNIIDAGSATARVDALIQVYTNFKNQWPRQAVYGALSILDDGSGGAAVVRATGTDSEDTTLIVVTDYILEPDADHVEIRTKVVNRGENLRPSFELGDNLAFWECDKFIPGYGYETLGPTSSPWLAAADGKVSYGYASPDTSEIWGDQGEAWSHMNVQSAYLEPGDSTSYSRYLVIGGRDIASVAGVIHQINSTPVGTVHCLVTEKSTGDPVAGASIEALNEQGFPYLGMLAGEDGLADATLPAGTWRLAASAKRLLTDEQTLTIGAGEVFDRHFALERDPSIPPTGDTLTIIQRPLLNIPSFVFPGDTLKIECSADPSTTGWTAQLLRRQTSVWLPVVASAYDASTLWWMLEAEVPADAEPCLYDLVVTYDGGAEDTTWHAVSVVPAFKEDYYFVHVTDTHLPTHEFSSNGWISPDTSEMVDFREVINDINLINPEFVIHTGDLINEGELEDYLDVRAYTKAQAILAELEVPVFLVAGNHDIGGWSSTPPPDGTARRDWWRFFGWSRLDDPPPGAPWYTQNYSFDYGPVHYTGLEAYDNYDRWRQDIYGRESFTVGQMNWLSQDLAAASGSEAQVLFYHYDFDRQIDVGGLGVELAIWGHIHRNSGDISSPPYNISTDNLCDRSRAYRLIRVYGGEIYPLPTISAGSSGNRLALDYSPANDGTHSSVTATITNGHNERFEHGMVRFRMPEACDSFDITGGTLARIEDLGSEAIYHVSVDILASGVQTVTVALDSSCTSLPGRLWLAPNEPNPFSLGTTFRYTVPRSGTVRLVIYDVQGRQVDVLVDRHMDAGEYEEAWAGRDRNDRRVASGVYFAGLSLGDQTSSRKIVLMRSR
jgi:hypothetical protein